MTDEAPKKVCGHCQTPKPIDDFGKNRSRKDGRNPNCRECHRQYTSGHYTANTAYYKAKATRHRDEVRAKIREVVLEAKSKPCADCGVSYPPYVMDLDHVRGKKLFEIGAAPRLGMNADRVREEIEKCEAVCANCHRQRTHDRRQKRPRSSMDRAPVYETGSVGGSTPLGAAMRP